MTIQLVLLGWTEGYAGLGGEALYAAPDLTGDLRVALREPMTIHPGGSVRPLRNSVEMKSW